ncbi:uncharacterized protein pkdc isoform X2 [Astatotilapia calliptera]|uniref:uncharacterized protein pkdc isoform X2 n=1 Tax=Astatotilapia calliptera TaxID=8154 RepID=UPI000E40B473|nr:uncharacterized protein LOC113031699 isoform X2 [Astatotilapia calliptera]
MKQEYQDLILQACDASSLRVGAKIQTLWSGYGEIVRLHLEGCNRPSVVVKHVKFPEEAEHPGGWNTDRSHTRKVKSYQVETHWYQNYSTNQSCRIPACLAACSYGDEMLIVLEDLDVAGYDQRRTSVTDREIKACLSWLAHFHALFLGVAPEGLWPVGTYWHLETRPDELEAMDDAELKAAAGDIDRILRSCMEERECEKRVPGLLDYYFSELKLSLKKDVEFHALEKEWREMFAFAWTDFHRFLLGWRPGHWKINQYSKQLTKEVLRKLKQ